MESDQNKLADSDAFPKGRVRTARLTRFRPAHRRFIADLTRCSTRMEDLAESFPAMLFALATGYGTVDERDRCFNLIHDGASLKEAALALGLPYWLRRLPAGAFQKPIPALPDGEVVLREIAGSIPSGPLEAGHWLDRVAFAYAAVGQDYAIWLARQSRFPFRRLSETPYTLLAAWAWHARHSDTFAGSLLRQHFDPKISIKRAYEEARAWHRRLDLAVTLGAGLPNTWFGPGQASGYEFVPLRTLDDFLAEASAMGNCLDQYAAPIQSGTVRVFSIRDDGSRIANVELAPHDDDSAMPMIEQLRGPCNARVPAKVWQASYAWLGDQTFEPLRVETNWPGRAEIWNKVWGPLIAATSGTEASTRITEFASEMKRRGRKTALAEPAS